jgi:hypothetical protein
MASLTSHVDQSAAHARGDIVAGDKETSYHFHIGPSAPTGIVEKMMERLSAEIQDNLQVQNIISSLQFFYIQKSKDGIIGLEAKLIEAGRDEELLFAYEKKELFAKLLDKYSLYESAQRIFAYLLAKAEHEFSHGIHPQLAVLGQNGVTELVTLKIVVPIVQECGVGPIDITHSVVMGMIYWLAEQCFIRWHE